MNRMIIFNSEKYGFNKQKAAIALGIICLFLLAVKILGAGSYEQSPQPVQENAQYQQDEVQNSEQVIKDEIRKEADFFSGYRLAREQVRGRQIDLLNEVIKSQNKDQQAQLAAANRLVKITEDMEEEMKAEHLLKSKGYRDCVIIMQAGTTTAVIQSSPLSVEEKTELQEMLGRIMNCQSEAVSIIASDGEY